VQHLLFHVPASIQKPSLQRICTDQWDSPNELREDPWQSFFALFWFTVFLNQ
jgi:hypothetical protein